MKKKRIHLLAVCVIINILLADIGGTTALAAGPLGSIPIQNESGDERSRQERNTDKEPETETGFESESGFETETDSETEKNLETETGLEAETQETETLQETEEQESETVEADYSWYAKTEETVYEIDNEMQLRGLAHIVNGTNGRTADDFNGKTIRLTADLELSHQDIEQWEAIGSLIKTESQNVQREFSGTFDGNNKRIFVWGEETEKGRDFKKLFGTLGTQGHIQNLGIMFDMGLAQTVEGCVENCFYIGKENGKENETTLDFIGRVAKEGQVMNCFAAGGEVSFIGEEPVEEAFLENNYVLGDTFEKTEGIIAKTEEEFASGETTWQLNRKLEKPFWGQEIGVETYPVFLMNSSEEAVQETAAQEEPENIVYRLAFFLADGSMPMEEAYRTIYTNGTAVIPELPEGSFFVDQSGAQWEAGTVTMEEDLSFYIIDKLNMAEEEETETEETSETEVTETEEIDTEETEIEETEIEEIETEKTEETTEEETGTEETGEIEVAEINVDNLAEQEDKKSIASQVYGIYIEPIEKQIYDGKAKKPKINVYDTGTLLKAGKDYTVKYKNNVAAGTATVTVSGKGNYKSELTAQFAIVQKNIEDEDMSIVYPGAYALKNKAQTPVPTLKYGTRTLKKNTDFKITYKAAADKETILDAVQDKGNYLMCLEGHGNYAGILELPFEIADTTEKTMVSKLTTQLNRKTMYYTGQAIVLDGTEFVLTVKKGKQLLTMGEDYTVSYKNNKAIGTASLTISAKEGSAFAGSKTIKFQIKGTPISKAKIEGFTSKMPYTGAEIKQNIVLKYNDMELKEGSDYELSYLKNTDAGKASLIIKGKNGYSGEIKKSFTIEKAVLQENMITAWEEEKEHSNSGAKAGVTLYFGRKKLEEGKDYTVKYKNNFSVTTDTKKASLSVIGKGNYRGTLNNIKTFSIKAKPLAAEGITIETTDMVFSGKKKDNYLYKPKVAVYDNGKKIAAKEYEIVYEGNSQSELKESFSDGRQSTDITITVKGKEGRNYCKSKTAVAHISNYSLANAKVEKITPLVYKGEPLQLQESDFINEDGKSKVTIKIGTEIKELFYGEDFYVSSYKNSIFKGTASAVLRGTGNFCGGTKKITFKISPKELKEYGKTSVRYVDENFRDIIAPKVNEMAQIGESYTFEPKEIEGYHQIDTESVTVTIEKGGDIKEVVFRLEKDIIYGTADVFFRTKDGTDIREPKKIENLNVEETHQISAEQIEGYSLAGDYVYTLYFEKGEREKEVVFEYFPSASSEIYTIELERFGIDNTGKEATKTTRGINEGIRYGLEQGCSIIKLPPGYYLIDSAVTEPYIITDKNGKTWKHSRAGIVPESDMQLELTDVTLKQLSTDYAYTAVITISGCQNTKIIGGTIIGDKEDHYYGTRINENGTELEKGTFDAATGKPIDDGTQKMRTKDFISVFVNKDGSVKELPSQFYLMPLWNTSMNTVDGGVRYIFCYDEAGNYLGMSEGGNGFVKLATLKEGTKKIKVSFKNEVNEDAAFYITEEPVYPTFEFGVGISVGNSDNVEIIGSTIKDATGDCIYTYPIPLDVAVNNFSIIDCHLSGSRRQGISFVGNGENNLVKGTTISDINGIDPQCGIDFEHYDYCRKTVIDDCIFDNNKKLDIINYNGTEIEIKNSTFSGLVGTTFGHTMNIHDNLFEYKPNERKIHKSAGVHLTTHDNKVWNNRFVNAALNVYGENSEVFGNHISEGTTTIRNTYRNTYENMKDVYIARTEDFSVFEGSQFINSNVSVGSNFENDFPLTIRNCTFKNSKLNGRGVTNIEMCSFEFEDGSINLTDGFASESSESHFYKCDISIPDGALLQGGKRKISFRDCNIRAKRMTNIQYGSTSFEDTHIIFETGDSDKTKEILFNRGGYGEASPWYFRNCTFEAEDPVAVYSANGHDTNQVIGPVTLK